MSRPIVFRLLAVALALVLSLLTAEVVLRLAPSRSSRTAPLDPRWEWVGPGEKRSRAAPRVAPKPDGAFRLVTLGDSFTWGAGVYPEDTWSARLERRLESALPRLEIDRVNLSRPGWNTFQQHWWLQREIDALSPDVAVLGFCLNDAEPFDEEELARLQEVLGDLASGGPPEERSARGPSAVVSRLGRSWSNWTSRRRVRAYHHSLYGDTPGWSKARTSLAGLGRIAGQRRFPLLMVIFPVFDSQLDDRYPYRELHETARRAGEEAGLPVLDLLPFYEGVDARRLAVVPFTDPHPNELAHRIAADAIAGYLIDRSMLAIEEKR